MLSERLLSHRLTLIFVCAVAILTSCNERKPNPNADLSLSYYDALVLPSCRLSEIKVRKELRRMVANDSDSTLSDFYAKKYYDRRGPLIWVSRKGVIADADTLLERLNEVEKIGFNPSRFRVPQIKQDLERIHALHFDKTHRASKVFARLEYNLTKALFRFAAGQRYGYSIPNNLFNRLDLTDPKDPSSRSYRELYALDSPRPSKRFYEDALHEAGKGALAAFLDSCEPHSPLYTQLVNSLHGDSARLIGRQLILVNLERSRWRMKDYPWKHNKYVLVNLPSLHLLAKGEDDALTMRIGCGAMKTKTPLLQGSIYRIDVNPQWIMPRSIVKKSIIHRLGNRWYFASKHYFIRDRATGKNIPPYAASPDALLNGSQLAIQEGGEGNALGRLIFRFNNGLSIYLHDTSSKGVFSQSDRDVSHGCIRVEKPFQLASFLLGKDNQKTIDKIWYSIHADVSPLGKSKDELSPEQQAVADTLKRNMLIGKADVGPKVPVFIWYFTLYPDVNGVLRTYNDLYGYDSVIYDYLKNYL
jgi:murein L,D-transpeptidase YcbB/YkuD